MNLPNINKPKAILWIIYIALLGVLLPHTAWAFSLFEPRDQGLLGVKWGVIVAWLAAFVFESAIAALTHRLSEHIERVPNYKDKLKKFTHRYFNAYSLGLIIAVVVSAFANLAHAVEYSQTMQIFENWGIPQGIYSIAFGAILPFCSLLFARVISDVDDVVQEEDRQVKDLKSFLQESRSKVNGLEKQLAEKMEVLQDRESRLAEKDKECKRLNEELQKVNALARLWNAIPPLMQAVARYVVLSEGTQEEIASRYEVSASKVSRMATEVKDHLQE